MNSKWTKEKLIIEMKKYYSRLEFKQNSGSAYNAAIRLDKKEPGFIEKNSKLKTLKNRWTRESLICEMNKYSSLEEFRLKSSAAHAAAFRWERKEPGFRLKNCRFNIRKKQTWKREKLFQIIKKHKTLKELRVKNPQALSALFKLLKKKDQTAKKTYDQLKREMTKKTDLELIKIAKKYKTLKEFQKRNKNEYSIIIKRSKTNSELRNKAFEHILPDPSNGKVKRTKRSLQKEALKYRSRIDFCSNSLGFYQSALRINKKEPGFMDKICSHMLKNYDYKEKKFLIKLQKIIKKRIKLIGKVHCEMQIPIRDNKSGRVDLFIKTKEFCFVIECKHDEAKWSLSHIEGQIRKYNRAFRERKGFLGTLVVSPEGKYGISEEELLTGYLPLLLLAL